MRSSTELLVTWMDSNSYRLRRWKLRDKTHNSKMEETGSASANCLTFKIKAWGLLDSKQTA